MNIKVLIKKYEKYLKEDKYQELFEECKDADARAALVDFLYAKCGINFLDFMTTIPNGLFALTNDITSVNIPDTITDIGEAAFANSKVNKVRLPNTITKIPAKLFSGCENLHRIFIPDSVVEFSRDVFKGTPDDLVIGANFRGEPEQAFKFPSSEIDFYKNHMKFVRR